MHLLNETIRTERRTKKIWSRNTASSLRLKFTKDESTQNCCFQSLKVCFFVTKSELPALSVWKVPPLRHEDVLGLVRQRAQPQVQQAQQVQGQSWQYGGGEEKHFLLSALGQKSRNHNGHRGVEPHREDPQLHQVRGEKTQGSPVVLIFFILITLQYFTWINVSTNPS